MKDTDEFVKFIEPKGGRNCELIQNVLDADRAVAADPLLDKKIAKQEASVNEAQKNLREVSTKLKDDVFNTVTKADYQRLLALGPDPFENPKSKFETPHFNQDQRALLKEKYPELYKKLLTHDAVASTEQLARTNLKELQLIQDRPTNARLDLAQFYSKTGQNDAAISTLTEVAGLHRSKEQELYFRDQARQTGAAWDPVFRKIIEASGGNILDYVERPFIPMRKEMQGLKRHQA